MNSTRFPALTVLLLFFIFIAVTTSASATNSIDFSNNGGTLSGTNAGLTLTGSTLISVMGWNGSSAPITGNLGTVTFTTGARAGGSLGMGGTLASGGSFQVDGNGSSGLPNGVLFSATFAGPATWTMTKLANGTHNYTLTGVLTGTMGTSTVNAVTVQLTVNTGKSLFDGSATFSGGDTTIGSVPEPSSLALLGSGAIVLFGAARRKNLVR